MRPWLDIKELRDRRGWLQWETAEKLGVSRSYLSAVENHKRGISITLVNALIRVFGVKYEDFYVYNPSDNTSDSPVERIAE